jgi:hypothetical protein
VAQAIAEVVGLKALMKDINRLTKDERSPLFARMKEAGYEAVKPIVPAARSPIPSSDRKESKTHKHGALAASVRASGYRSGAAVRMGSKSKVPYAGWMEFGGTRHKPHDSTREFIATGRYLWPAATDLAPRAETEYIAAINDIVGRPAIWTNGDVPAGSVHD